MQRLIIMLSPKLKAQVQRRAKERKVSVSDLVRESLEAALEPAETGRRVSDPLFTDKAVFSGDAPSDLSRNHDRYLYED
jgi:hypothetical protein